jgi:hypothetical protein
LQYIKMDEEDFLDIAMTHQVTPWRFEPAKVEPGPKLPDHDQWNLNP